MNFQVVVDALTKIVTDIVNFIPNLINGLIILIVGYLIAAIVRWVLLKALQQLRFDTLIERTGMTGALRGLGVKISIAWLLAQTIFALLLLSFLITSTRLMGLEAVATLLEDLLYLLPNGIAAAIIFLIGGMAAQFVGNLVAGAALAGGISNSARLGRIVQYIISVFVVILALSQLGLDTAILVTAITIVIAAFGLALALALGLGARTIIGHVLAGYYIRQRFPIGERVTIGRTTGTVNTVGGVNTVVDMTDGERVVVPNSRLLETVVRSPRAETPSDPSSTP